MARAMVAETFPLEMSLSAIDLPEGIGFLGVIRDLTDSPAPSRAIDSGGQAGLAGPARCRAVHEINNPLAYVTNLAVLQRDVSILAEALGAYEEALPTLDSSHPELGERSRAMAAASRGAEIHARIFDRSSR